MYVKVSDDNKYNDAGGATNEEMSIKIKVRKEKLRRKETNKMLEGYILATKEQLIFSEVIMAHQQFQLILKG